MKKFEFRLQRLLDIRAAKEKEIQNELAGLVSLQNAERAKQDDLRAKMKELGGQLREQWQKGSFNSTATSTYWDFQSKALKSIKAADLRIASLEPAVNEVRSRLIEASREKKVVEKLKERKFEEYNYELNRELAKESDDMNQKIYMRNLAEMEAL